MTAASATTATPQTSVLRRLLRSPFFWAALIGVISMPLIRPFMRHVPAPPPVAGQLPAFSLVDQRGETFGSEQLRGQVYVASFFSTRCDDPCPELTRAMKSLAERYALNEVAVKLVSFSVDPVRDDPRALRRFARTHGVDARRWTLLTGEAPQMRALLLDGYVRIGERLKVSLGTELRDLHHAARFAIVDRQGGVRGFYSTTERGLDEIYHRSQHVLKEER